MKPKIILLFFLLIFFSSFLGGFVFLGDITLLQVLRISAKATLLIGVLGLTISYVVLKCTNEKHANNLLINLAIILATSTILLTAGEYAFRYYYRDVTTTGDNRSYFAKKWNKTVHRNRFNFREKDFDLEKPKKIYRIAVIGDSFTFGAGINEEDRFSNVLEKELNSKNDNVNIKYEVLNFGIPGAETVDHIHFLNDFVLASHPDFILLQWYINDVLDPLEKKRKIKEKSEGKSLFGLSKAIEGKYNRLCSNSVLFYLFNKQMKEFRKEFLSKTSSSYRDFDETMLARFGDRKSIDSQKASAAMEKFYQITREHNIPMGIIMFSDSYFRPYSKLDFLLARVIDFCSDKQLTCIDMRQPLAPYQGDMRLWASRLDPHPSAFVNRIAADRILKEFGPVWLKHAH